MDLLDGLGKQRSPIRHDTDDFAFRLEEGDAGFYNRPMIVSEQHAWTRHSLLLQQQVQAAR